MSIRIGGNNPAADPMGIIGDMKTQDVVSKPGGSGFRRVLGGVLGGVGNMFMPGIGGALGSILGGGSNDPYQFLKVQMDVQNQARVFEMQSNIIKSRHDSSMAAIRNLR